MRKFSLLTTLLAVLSLVLLSCSKSDSEELNTDIIGTLQVNGKSYNIQNLGIISGASAAYENGYGNVSIFLSQKNTHAVYGDELDLAWLSFDFENPICPVKGDVISDMSNFELDFENDFEYEKLFPNNDFYDCSFDYVSGALKVLDISNKGKITLSFENLKMEYSEKYPLTINGKITIPWQEYR